MQFPQQDFFFRQGGMQFLFHFLALGKVPDNRDDAGNRPVPANRYLAGFAVDDISVHLVAFFRNQDLSRPEYLFIFAPHGLRQKRKYLEYCPAEDRMAIPIFFQPILQRLIDQKQTAVGIHHMDIIVNRVNRAAILQFRLPRSFFGIFPFGDVQ